MSESQHDEHTSFIKTPKQLIIVIALAFVVPIALIVLLTQLVTRGEVDRDDPAHSEEAVAQRLKPVGEVVIADASGPKTEKTGEQVVQTVCAACHGTGALNAPKIGDTARWKPLIARGQDDLTANAIKGIRAMPPRGGNPDLSDTEVARAVAYMANKAGASFKEPAARPAAAPAGAPASATTAAPAAATAAAPAPAAAPAAKVGDSGKGKQVYDTTCMACHGAGVAGAPKFGDKAAWAPRIKAGLDALHASALKGKGAMPPKGGNPSLPDADVAAAVDYMVSQSK